MPKNWVKYAGAAVVAYALYRYAYYRGWNLAKSHEMDRDAHLWREMNLLTGAVTPPYTQNI